MRYVALMIGCAMLVGACSTDPTTRSAQEGAGAGAVGGALLCVLARCNREQYALAVGAGAAVGAGVGYSLAKDIGNRRKQLAGRENDLDARLDQARGLNSDLERFNAALNEQVRDAEANIDQRQVSQAQLMKTRSDVDKQVDAAAKLIAAAERELDDLKRFRAQRPPGNASPALDAEIAKYEGLLAQSRSNTQALASARQRI